MKEADQQKETKMQDYPFLAERGITVEGEAFYDDGTKNRFALNELDTSVVDEVREEVWFDRVVVDTEAGCLRLYHGTSEVATARHSGYADGHLSIGDAS